MSKGGSRWQDGRRAWQRLTGWYQNTSSAVPGHPDDGDGAVAALADIGLVRRLLDQAELVAVRTARRHSKSWAEIATQLGVTRQSAWERWRELDDGGAAGRETTEDVSPRDAGSDVEAGAAAALEAVAADAAERAARERRRRSSVVVPNVIGMSFDDARRTLIDKRLVGVGPDPDGPPLAALGWPTGVVTDQSPESGAKVPPGSPVTLWVERGGGSGVREPRRPKPVSGTGREMHHEPSDEAVG
jgi:DNA-binding Lrp family transcriptional regulator